VSEKVFIVPVGVPLEKAELDGAREPALTTEKITKAEINTTNEDNIKIF
jgi:hypothetical protein